MPSAVMISQLKTAIAGLSPARKLTLVALVAAMVAGFAYLISWSGQQQFHHLFTNLAPEDAGDILSYLKERKVPYQVAAGGSAIMVPEDRVYESRMELASRGLPQGSGVGFEVFDNSRLGMTEFVQNVNYQRALQGELSRTINQIAEVESSRVHIVMPSRSVFIEDEEPASASVVVNLRRGKWLSPGQVEGIVHLVSASVARLSPERVTIVDSSGKLLAGFTEGTTLAKLSSDQLEYQEKLERNLESRVKTMLEKALGRDRAVVRIACALNFKRQEMTEERYYPDNRVIRSEQVLKEKSGDRSTLPAGVPGVRSNLARRPSTGVGTDEIEFEKNDRTVNYEIGKLVSHIVEPTANLKRISAAVVVDGTYEQVQNRSGGIEWKYTPRSAEEMDQIKAIVMRAINFDEQRGDKVEVANIPFGTEKLAEAVEEKTEHSWMDKLSAFATPLRYVLLAVFMLCCFLFVVRPLSKWLTAAGSNSVEMLQQFPKTVSEIENELGGGGPYREELNQLLISGGDISAGVTRDWMQEK